MTKPTPEDAIAQITAAERKADGWAELSKMHRLMAEDARAERDDLRDRLAALTDAIGAHGNGLLAEIERHIYNERHGINEYGRLEGAAARVQRLLAAPTPPPHRCDPSCRPDDHRVPPPTPMHSASADEVLDEVEARLRDTEWSSYPGDRCRVALLHIDAYREGRAMAPDSEEDEFDPYHTEPWLTS